jgi:hypothetical protein
MPELPDRHAQRSDNLENKTPIEEAHPSRRTPSVIVSGGSDNEG